jgi:hypothetical protein
MANQRRRYMLAQLLAAATLAFALVYTVGFFSKSLDIASERNSAFAAIGLSVAAFAMAIKIRSMVVAGLLTASGIIMLTPPIEALAAVRVILIPGPILGVIFYAPILGLGIAKAVTSTMMKRTVNTMTRDDAKH